MIVGTLGRKHKGQALTEMLITFAWGIPLLLVIVQLGMLYRTKATLNDATFRAAREGSLHHAYTAVMEDALVRGMMPSQYAVKPGNKPSLLDYELSKENNHAITRVSNTASDMTETSRNLKGTVARFTL